MPSLCFPSPGSDSDNSAGPVLASVENALPRPRSAPRGPGSGYAGMLDSDTAARLQAEAAGGEGAATFAASRRGNGLWLLILVAAGAYYLSENR